LESRRAGDRVRQQVIATLGRYEDLQRAANWNGCWGSGARFAVVAVVGGLIGLMAAIHLAPMFAALYVFVFVGAALFVINLTALLGPGHWSFAALIAPIRRFLEAYTDMVTDLALLLATLSIMTGALVITGVPTKLGSLLVEAAGPLTCR
jgi:TRAP-type uncharacterized transport system fused permease subunit